MTYIVEWDVKLYSTQLFEVGHGQQPTTQQSTQALSLDRRGWYQYGNMTFNGLHKIRSSGSKTDDEL